MDNASKALIMAGAILIAVALVGVGVYLYQSAAGTVGTGVDQLNAASMETKNAMIEQYEGDIKGSDLKQLVRRINSYNESDVFPQDLEFESTGSTISKDASTGRYSCSANNSAIYKVEISTYTNGYAHKLKVSP